MPLIITHGGAFKRWAVHEQIELSLFRVSQEQAKDRSLAGPLCKDKEAQVT
jgi:hypothetical protein